MLKKLIFYTFCIIFLQCCKDRQENSFVQKQAEPEIESNRDSLSNAETQLLRNGDIIMRQGRGAISMSISTQLNEKCMLSHCGIVSIDGDSINIIHTLSQTVSNEDGMQKATLNEFTDDTYENSLVVVRLKNTDNSKIANRAKYYLAKKIPFDHDFNVADTTQFFCNELISHILTSEYAVNVVDTSTSDPMQNLRFGRLLDTTKFEIIINHQQQ